MANRAGPWVALVALAGAGIALACRPASAQEPDDRWIRSFYNLERSHIDHPVGKGLIFEAQLAPQIVVAQSLQGLFRTGAVAADTKPHWGYSLSISPMVRLRMINTASQPVRTPSYMPHGVAQLFRVKNLSHDTAESARRRGPYEMWTVQARLSHHSNGQDGCLYLSQQRNVNPDGSFDCDFLPGYGPAPANLNLADGSFSKNFARGGVFYRRMYLPEGVDDTMARSWYLGATVESHRSFLVNWIPGRSPMTRRSCTARGAGDFWVAAPTDIRAASLVATSSTSPSSGTPMPPMY